MVLDHQGFLTNLVLHLYLVFLVIQMIQMDRPIPVIRVNQVSLYHRLGQQDLVVLTVQHFLDFHYLQEDLMVQNCPCLLVARMLQMDLVNLCHLGFQ